MRTAVFILLPWLLLLPLSWGLDLSSCAVSENHLDMGGGSCHGNWNITNTTLKFYKLKGFVREVADKCYNKFKKGNWADNKKAAECTINTLYDRGCSPYEAEHSQAVERSVKNKRSTDWAHPYELVCEYIKERIKKENKKSHEDLQNCQNFHFNCQAKLHSETTVSEYVCNSGKEVIEKHMSCPTKEKEDIGFVRKTIELCSEKFELYKPDSQRKCLFKTLYKVCSKNSADIIKKTMKRVCKQINPRSNLCGRFARECLNKFLPTTTTTVPTTPTTTTQEKEKTTAATLTTITAKPITQTNTSDILPSIGSPTTASTTASPSPTTKSTKASTAAPNATEASTTQTKTTPTEPTTTSTASMTAKPTTKSEAKTTAQAPPSSTTAKTSTEATTLSPTTTVLSNSPSTTKTTTSLATSGDLSGGQTRPNGPAPPKSSKKETTTETPPDEAEDAQRHGSGDKGSKADNKEEEATNLTPLWVILGIFAVVLVVAGIVVGVIVRKKWKKKKAEKEGNSKSKSTAPPKKSNKPSRAVVPKGQKKTVAANAKPPTAKETEEQMVMQGGSNDGFKREGPLTMDVGIRKGEVVEHVTKEDDGHVLQTVVIDETMNNMFDIGSDIEHVVTDEGAEDGGGGAPKEKKPEEQKSAKSGLKSAVKSSAGT